MRHNDDDKGGEQCCIRELKSRNRLEIRILQGAILEVRPKPFCRKKVEGNDGYLCHGHRSLIAEAPRRCNHTCHQVIETSHAVVVGIVRMKNLARPWKKLAGYLRATIDLSAVSRYPCFP